MLFPSTWILDNDLVMRFRILPSIKSKTQEVIYVSSYDHEILQYFKARPPKVSVATAYHSGVHSRQEMMGTSGETNYWDYNWNVFRIPVDCEGNEQAYFRGISPTEAQMARIEPNIQTPYHFQHGHAEHAHEDWIPSNWAMGRSEEMKECDFIRSLEEMELSVFRHGQLPTSLHFNNPTESFSTRWDVVYKTLLRDCRKFYSEAFQLKNMRKSHKRNHLYKNLDEFVDSKFGEFSDVCKGEIKFYLGSLIYPKQMAAFKLNSYDDSDKTQKSNERIKRVKKIRELHDFLYNFSMEKCERFFSNQVLCILFKYYMIAIQSRIESSTTMGKNKGVYYNALKLILIKINNSLR